MITWACMETSRAGNGFVAHDELRVQGQGPGDSHPLALAAAELMRVPGPVVGFEAHRFHEFGDTVLDFRTLCHFVHQERFADDLADGHSRVERRVGVLKDDLHVFSEFPHLPPGKGPQRDGFKEHIPVRRFEEPEDQPSDGGFPAARFPDETQDFTLRDLEGDPVHRLHMAGEFRENAPIDGEILPHVPHGQQKRRRSRSYLRSSVSSAVPHVAFTGNSPPSRRCT